MSVTVKNMTAADKIALPRPFLKTLAAGASATVTGLNLDGIDKRNLDKLKDLANAGKITITETDETLQRGTVADASVADIHQLLQVGQTTAADGDVSAIAVVERPSKLVGLECFFDAVPAATETITLTLTRNGESVLSADLVVDDSSTLPSEAASLLADQLDKADGATTSADTDKFTSAGVTFTAAHVGNIIMLTNGNANDGAYIVAAYTDGDNVNLTDLEGADPGFITASAQNWDMILALQPGDVLILSGTVANKTNLGYWCARAIIQPR